MHPARGVRPPEWVGQILRNIQVKDERTIFSGRRNESPVDFQVSELRSRWAARESEYLFVMNGIGVEGFFLMQDKKESTLLHAKAGPLSSGALGRETY